MNTLRRRISSLAARGVSELLAVRDGLPIPAEPAPSGTKIGVWAGRSAIKNPIPAVAAAAKMGIGHLHLMVNDHSAQRQPLQTFMARPSRGFATAKPSTLLAVARECRRHSVCLHLTTWVMPHDAYAEGMIEYLGTVTRLLREVSPIQSVVLDAEEPWVRASVQGADRHRVARRIGEGLNGLGLLMGVTGIGFLPDYVLPLLASADYGVPQCYLTKGGSLRRSGASRAIAKWQRTSTGDLAIGLAGYRTTPTIMRQGVDLADDLPTIWWSLNSLRRSSSRRSAMMQISGV